MKSGWVGVDLDGTLAHYEGWVSGGKIGHPVPAMLARVKAWIESGTEVRIMTARVSGHDIEEKEFERKRIEDWCKEHIGEALKVTNEKDFAMIELWDDRAVRVEMNTGKVVGAY